MCLLCVANIYVEAFINVLSGALMLAIFVRVLLSWIPTRLPWGLGEFVFSVTEPILAPIRRRLPSAAGLDISPFIAIVAIQAASLLLLRLLPPSVQ
ncbi:MAG TPA: YggT family protein [Candidatus Limnocylindria bacterium]